MVNPVIMPPFKAFSQVHCMKLGKPVSQFGLNTGMLLTLLLLSAIFSFAKRMKSHSAKSGEHGKCRMTVMSFSQNLVAVHFMSWLYFTVLWINPNEIPNIIATSSIMTLLFQGQVLIWFACWLTSQLFGNFISNAPTRYFWSWHSTQKLLFFLFFALQNVLSIFSRLL